MITTNTLKLSYGDDKKVITFTINKALKTRLRELLDSSTEYTLKQKSIWVNEAIVMLMNNPDYKELARNAEGNTQDFVFDKIYMTFEQRCFFAEMRNETVRAFPDIRGPQGAIIRAAILSRLTRKL